jgi:small subunit ribosomal protein S13
MARIAGVNIHPNRQIAIGLTAIYGVGRSRAMTICMENRVDPAIKVSALTEVEINTLRQALASHILEGDLRREVNMNIKRLKDLKTYRGVRHRRGLPVRGQRTHTNAKTRKRRRRA